MVEKYDQAPVEEDLKVYVHDSISMVYPSWIQSEVIANTIGLNSASTPDSNSSTSSLHNRRAPEILLPSRETMTKARIVSTPRGSRRQETVLISVPDRNCRTDNSMSFRKAAQILLLFRCRLPLSVGRLRGGGVGWNELAYVSWFDTKVAARNNPNGLYLVVRSRNFGIVDIADIERPILLIPKFGETVGATVAVKKKLDEAKLHLRDLQRQAKLASKSGDSRNSSLLRHEIENIVVDSMWYYNEFFIDSWQDSHSYKNIY
jgi:hypothetical protein